MRTSALMLGLAAAALAFAKPTGPAAQATHAARAAVATKAAEASQAAPPAPPLLRRVSVVAWLGSWKALRSPAAQAPRAQAPPAATAPTGAQPKAAVEMTSDLENAFRVVWRRRGPDLRVKITRLSDVWVGRLALELRFAPDTQALWYGDEDVPVRVPVAEAKQGQVMWAWERGVPAWLLGEDKRGTAGVAMATTNSHGFFLYRYPDGDLVAHIAVDWPKVGRSVELAFRIVRGTTPDALEASRRRRLGIPSADPPLTAAEKAELARVRAAGFVRVDRSRWGFVTSDGKPFRVLGQNTPHLPMLSPAAQEKLLAQSQAAGITVTRFLIPDYVYRPMGAWNDEAYRRLRATVDRCAAHGIRVILCLEYSGCGDQYNITVHRTPNWSDLYLLPDMLEWYRGTVMRVVVPLRDDPSVMAYDVSNEPDLALSPATPTLTGAWHKWLRTRYGTVEKLRAAWGEPSLPSFDAAPIPGKDDYDWQRTPAARDFFAFGGDAIGRSMIERARAVREADPNHLITVSAWDPRLLRGLPGADLFDYWSPHSYEIYFLGRAISDQVMYQVGVLRRALPDRPRPVVIEEFGLPQTPKFPEPMRAEHLREFLAAGNRWDAGMMFWYDLTHRLLHEFWRASRLAPAPPQPREGPTVAFYLPPSAEWHVLIYSAYMWRRKWGEALASARTAGLGVREAVDPAGAKSCRALLVLADSLTPAEAAKVRAMGLPVVLTPGAAAAKKDFPAAAELPADWTGQVAFWQKRLGAAGH